MPYTTLRNGGTAVIGDTTTGLIPQGLHPSAAAYLAALKSSSYSPSRTEIDAVNNLVLGLVANGIYTKIKALYPIIGGTAATHKWNLINPVDTPAGFRLTFTGTWTHSSTGMKGDGSTAYANTFLTPSTSLTFPSGHLSVYSRTQLQEVSDVPIGCTSGTTTLLFMTMAMARTTNVTSFGFPSGGTSSAQATSQSASTGFFCGTRTSAAASDLKVTRNGVILAVAATNGTNNSAPANPIYIGAANSNTGAANFCLKQFAFASIGDGLTDLEVRIFATLVQAYQTSLGRNI